MFVESSYTKLTQIEHVGWYDDVPDTEDGAEASALFYSLIVTAKVNGVNPQKILETIFTEIPKATTLEDIERLVDLVVTRPLAS